MPGTASSEGRSRTAYRRGALIRRLPRRFFGGNFDRVGCRSASGHLINADPVEDRRTPFPPLSGDASRLPPHRAVLQNFERVSARADAPACQAIPDSDQTQQC